TDTWVLLPEENAPQRLVNVTATAAGRYVVVWGHNTDHHLRNGRVYSLDLNQWLNMPLDWNAPGRKRHVAVGLDDARILFYDADMLGSDMTIYDVQAKTWIPSR